MRLSQINVPFKDNIDSKILAEAIKEMKEIHMERMEILFTEVGTKELFKWMIENNISIDNMKEYYEKYIKPRCLRNRLLEDFFEIL